MQPMESSQSGNNMGFSEILNQHPILQQDTYTQDVLRDRIASNGKPIDDIESFLIMRGVILEEEVARRKLEELKRKNPENYIVANAVRPDLEKYIN